METIEWVTAFLDRPADGFPAAVAFWQWVTGSGLSAPRGDGGQFATLLPRHGDGYLRVQRVDRGPGGTHLDLHTADLAGTAARARDLGAEVVADHGDVVVLRSPAGLAHCSAADPGERARPAPVPGSGGATLLDQVCIDIAPDAFARELAYWQALTGWRRDPGTGGEFARLLPPDRLPLQLLLQRLADPPPDGLATAHPDLASADADAAAAEHERHGARVLARFPGWVTLADPAGLPYCLTRRPPSLTRPHPAG